jgi:hypothetical protein
MSKASREIANEANGSRDIAAPLESSARNERQIIPMTVDTIKRPARRISA